MLRAEPAGLAAISCTANARITRARKPVPYGIIQVLALSLPHGFPLYPELLDHCPHRSWEVDTGGPAPRIYWGSVSARDDGAGPRHHGPRARTRHYHQSPRRSPELQG